MNKAFYLFQRKIFSSRPLNTAGGRKTFSPLLFLEDRGRHGNHGEHDASSQGETKIESSLYQLTASSSPWISFCKMRSAKFDLPTANSLTDSAFLNDDNNEVMLYIIPRKRERHRNDRTLRTLVMTFSVARCYFQRDPQRAHDERHKSFIQINFTLSQRSISRL